MRKFWFAYLAKALVIFPGGFGTMDEMFEILTLAQTQKLSKKLLVILYGSEYWDAVLDVEPLVVGRDQEADLDLLRRVDTHRRGIRGVEGAPHQAPHGAGDAAGNERRGSRRRAAESCEV